MKASNRVTVIGLDGATWDVLDPWIGDGTLPNLARLRREGSWGVLRSTLPPITAAAWSTFMTGKRPGKHGVYHFVELFGDHEAGADEAKLVDARSLQSATLWDVLGHHDRRSVLINIPMTYPPRPVNGLMVTGLLTPSDAPVFTYPPELSDEITDYQIDLDRFIDKMPHVDEFEPEITAPTLDLVEEFRAMADKRARVSLELMATDWDFFMVVFTGTDRMGHYLGPYLRDAAPDDSPQVRQLCEAVRRYYVRLDEIVGELVAQAGDATIIVMSDHGMGPTYRKRFHCNNWLQQQGWLAPQTDAGRVLSPDRVLKKLGVPRDKVGQLIRRIPALAQSRWVQKAARSRASTVDRSQSRAYCVPIFYNIFGIRLNVGDEEKEGMIEAMSRQLQTIVDPETGQRVVQEVCRADSYYEGPYTENIPDLLVTLDPDYGCSYHLSHYSALVTERLMPTGPGKHRKEGIFIATGPHVRAQPAPLPDLDIEDIAPTVLHLAGVPVPSDMDGRVLTEVMEDTFLNAYPVQQSAPVGYWPEEGSAAFADETLSAEAEEIIRHRLRALGYFE